MDWIRACFPRARLGVPDQGYARILHPLGRGSLADPHLSRLSCGFLLFDLETLGFLGHPVFLVGLMRRRPGRPPRAGRLEVLQFLARDYTEEEAILSAFIREAGRSKRWVSFNGKSFDLPFLRERAAFYGLRLPRPREHLDLLHAARRVYRRVLPNCRLQTLEASLFGRYRFRDLGGAEIPAAYHAWVRTGDPRAMGRILLHNRNDLVSLARLLAHLEETNEPKADEAAIGPPAALDDGGAAAPPPYGIGPA
jgi:uncharacterized protein YprB with RNaseH-like and TPR domain